MQDVNLPDGHEGRLLSGGKVQLADFPIIIGGFGPSDLTDIEIWLRLGEQEFGLANGWLTGLVQPSWPLGDVGLVSGIVPYSRHDKTCLITDPEREIEHLVGLKRVFAYAASKRLLMVGPPTEDAWERFIDSTR